jgi:predicted alpha-1,2-mannosidase
MKKILFILASAGLFWQCNSGIENTIATDKSYAISNATNTETYTNYVDCFLGVEQGNVFPGAALPFGLVRLGPDVLVPQPTSGYKSNQAIKGFSHLHTSGTGGGGRYGNVLIMPQVGAVDFLDNAGLPRNEYAKPGYYTVTLGRKAGDVKAELTATARAGYHRYTFFTWDKAVNFPTNIIIDLAHVVSRGSETDHRCTEAFIRAVSKTDLEGYAEYAGGWGGQNPYKVYFHITLDTPFDSCGGWDGEKIQPNSKVMSGAKTAFYVRFNAVKQKQIIQVKTGISLISIAQARLNLQQQIGERTFDEVRKNADKIWNEHLARFTVAGGTPEQRTMFYTSLYHTMLMPNDISGENPGWQTDEPAFWNHYCLWDVFRSVMPLHTIIFPQLQRNIVRSLLDIYKKKGWLPDAWIAGDYAMVQGGSNADVVIADAMVKKLKGFDYELAYQAVKKNADVPSDNPQIYGRLISENYKQKGWLEYGHHRCISRSLEYAYNDFCVGQVAQALNKKEDAAFYFNRSKGVFELFSTSHRFFVAKDSSGKVVEVSLEEQEKHYGDAPFYYEGDKWSYGTYTPHAIGTLVEKMGGKEKFVAHLDEMFDNAHYNLNNEPTFLVPYLYNYAGRPDKTAERVAEEIRKNYEMGRRGLPGQDDSGAISSWYVWSAAGIFPVAGQDIYLIGTPLFEQAVFALENGTFTITAQNLSTKNKYIKKALLNGVELKQSWFKHEAIFAGGKLILEMTDQPTNWAKDNLPPSL